MDLGGTFCYNRNENGEISGDAMSLIDPRITQSLPCSAGTSGEEALSDSPESLALRPPVDDYAASGTAASRISKMQNVAEVVQAIQASSLGASGSSVSSSAKGLSLGAAARVMSKGQVGCKSVWEFPTGGGVSSSPRIAPDGSIVVGSRDGKVYSIREGKKNWEFTTGDEVLSSPCFGPDGTAYIGSNDGKVYALKDGREAWSVQTTKPVETTPFLASDGMLYAGSKDGSVYFIKEGEVKFGHYLDDWPKSTIVGPDNTIYVGSYTGLIIALKPGKKLLSGSPKVKKLWQYATGNGLQPSNSYPVMAKDGTLFVGSGDGKLYAIKEGKEQWIFQVEKAIDGAPCLGPDGTVYVGSDNGKVYAVKDGIKSWEFSTGGKVKASPCLGPDGTVYAGSEDGKVYAIKNGLKLWEFQTGGTIDSSPCIDPDGTVYIGSNDGKVYALRAQAFEERAEDEEALQENRKSSVEKDDTWIVIDGVKIPVKKG
jgi:outer membrane protein assembly factor BamB